MTYQQSSSLPYRLLHTYEKGELQGWGTAESEGRRHWNTLSLSNYSRWAVQNCYHSDEKGPQAICAQLVELFLEVVGLGGGA